MTVREVSSSPPFPVFVLGRLFNGGHSDRCEDVPHYPLISFLLQMLTSFYVPMGHLLIFFGEISVNVFCSVSTELFVFIELYRLCRVFWKSALF